MKNFDIKTLIIIGLIIALMVSGGFFVKNNASWKTKYNLEVNLRDALEDTVDVYKNNEGEWVAEKKTLQTDIKTLEGENINLTDNQEDLVRRLKEEEKENDIFAAAMIDQKATIDSLLTGAVVVDTTKGTADFVVDSDSISFDIQVLNIKPLEGKNPELLIKNLEIPNALFVEFHWEEGKTHPVAMSVTNSNPMFKTNDIDSYAIPELQKDVVKPTGWKKIGNFFKKAGKYIGIGVGGALLGGLIVSGSG